MKPPTLFSPRDLFWHLFSSSLVPHLHLLHTVSLGKGSLLSVLILRKNFCSSISKWWMKPYDSVPWLLVWDFKFMNIIIMSYLFIQRDESDWHFYLTLLNILSIWILSFWLKYVSAEVFFKHDVSLILNGDFRYSVPRDRKRHIYMFELNYSRKLMQQTDGPPAKTYRINNSF